MRRTIFQRFRQLGRMLVVGGLAVWPAACAVPTTPGGGTPQPGNTSPNDPGTGSPGRGGPRGGGTGPNASGGGGTEPQPAQPLPIRVILVGFGSVLQSADGDLVTLTATPDDGWEFVGWSGADAPNENPLTVSVADVPEITATFALIGSGPTSGDSDGDGVADDTDNCPNIANLNQQDSDGDGVGDACDNCANASNSDQADDDTDGVGNACEGDRDSDGVTDDADNCPALSNAMQTDVDGDGVGDTCDNCIFDANTDQVDADGDGRGDVCDVCPNDAANDSDRDGVCGDIDACPGTARGILVNDVGCPISTATDTPCGDGTVQGSEECDDAGESAMCDIDCTLVVCGDGVLNLTAGEECDDGNTVSNDGCTSGCLSERPPNDDCASAAIVTDGNTDFNTTLAITDGAPAILCNLAGNPQIVNDTWFCYTPTCGVGETVVVSLCGSEYDTKMAVYEVDDCATACPALDPLRCSDDDCGAGASDARFTFNVTMNKQYLIRVGGFAGPDQQGRGTLHISCGASSCGPGGGDCLTARPTESGCSSAPPLLADCCTRVCDADPFCCDVGWDAVCVGDATGLCNPGGFASCASPSQMCDVATPDDGSPDPGCDSATDACGGRGCVGGTCVGGPDDGNACAVDSDCACPSCCEFVCETDPFCCINAWDDICAETARGMCALTCGPGAGTCFPTTANPNGTPGCQLQKCCDAVCVDDPFCCSTEWDSTCGDAARALGAACRP